MVHCREKIVHSSTLWEKKFFIIIFLLFSVSVFILPTRANTLGKQLPRSPSGDAKILLSACNFNRDMTAI